MFPYVIIPAQGSDQDDEWVRLGVEAHTTGNLPQAQQRYQQALRINPRNAVATQNLAVVYAQSTGFLNEGLLTIERAEMLDSKSSPILVNRALMALASDRIDEALASAKKAVELSPDDINSMLALALISATAGEPDKSIPLYNKILDKEPRHNMAGPNSCFVMSLIDATPEESLKQRQRWHKANRWDGDVVPHNNDKSTTRPLRVGYVGGDFKSHSASFIFGHVVMHHSKDIEAYLYSTLPVDPNLDAGTKSFMNAVGPPVTGTVTKDDISRIQKMSPAERDAELNKLADDEIKRQKSRWRDTSSMTDAHTAAMIRSDKIDILVDLAGHTNGGRLTLFTHKPAPVQVTAWGFAHGTGCPEIDYFFADPVSVPESERKHYAEKIVDLPCIVTMEPPAHYNLKGVSMAPIKKNGYFTFGSYARYEKMSEPCLRAFAEILRRVPDAKMEFKDHAYRRPYSIRRIMSIMKDIEPERLLFSISTSHSDHMLAYQQSDLCLDPWPHGGGAVALEQLYMGVPLLTRYGTQPSGRSASSVLTKMGKTDWIAKDADEFIEKAVAFADNPKPLIDARKTLREDFIKSPVVTGYVEAVEQAYRDIWKKWCEK